MQKVQTQQYNQSGSRSTSRYVEIDAKFSHLFHNVTEFPPPSPFTNLPKMYPSRNIKTTTGMLTH